jgi:Uma2 family endonuclease
LQFWGSSKAIVTNPYLVVEILSDRTRKYDLNEKTESYREIESIQQMIFIDGENKKISTYTRTADPKTWLWTTYLQSDDILILDSFTLKLSDIFANMPTVEE